MIQIPKIEWRPYLDMAWRRKWWIGVPLFLCVIAGGAHLYQSPKAYKASTLILVESQRVPQEYVPSSVSDDLEKRLQTISQQVHSRTNLENIIERFELFPSHEDLTPSLLTRAKRKLLIKTGIREASAWQEQSEGPSMQQVVRNVRNKIDVNLRASNQAFEISFEWRDPHVSAQVANALASQFIDQNLRVREEMAMGTTSFLDREVQRLQEELEKREKALEDFNRRNMGRLPSQLQSNLNMLSQLKEDLGRTEDRAEQIRQQIQMANMQARVNAQDLPGSPEGSQQVPEIQREYESLQGKLEEMRSRYTENHPDIRMLKRRLQQVKDKMDQEALLEPDTLGSEDRSASAEPDFMQMQVQEHRMRLQREERKTQDLQEQIADYEQRVEQTSEVELQLKNLERDYSAVRDRYQIMLRRKLDAELGEQMERRQQGEQFRVIDPAIPPDSPFSPDSRRIMLLSLVMGLGLGGGLGYLREIMDPALYTPEEVEQALNAEVVVSLPYVKKK